MASNSNTVARVREVLEPKILELGYVLWDLEYVKEAADWHLRFTIDNNEGITIDDCEKVHRFIDPILDELDPIESNYLLEVSSPGIERELKNDFHLESCIGDKIEVKFFAPIDGKKSAVGILTSFTKETITVEENGKNIEIPREKASKIKTVFDF